jgi:gamma-glutamyl-gamma-aminobutyrate hydrolase PuuD
MPAPRVAISPNRKTVDYERSVVEAGGDPLVVDLSSGSPATLLDGVGALLLTGGGDIDPALFGEEDIPRSRRPSGRDAAEIALLLQALQRACRCSRSAAACRCSTSRSAAH